MRVAMGIDECGSDRSLITSVNASFLAWWARGGYETCGGAPAWLVSQRPFDAESSARLAELPFLLPDLGFHDESLWQGWLRERAVGVEAPVVESDRVRLARHVLTLAWHLSRRGPRAALVLCGITSSLAELLARLELHELDRLAARSSTRLQLRWRGQTDFWPRVLTAMAGADSPEIERLTLVGLQMLCSSHAPFVSRNAGSRYSLIS